MGTSRQFTTRSRSNPSMAASGRIGTEFDDSASRTKETDESGEKKQKKGEYVNVRPKPSMNPVGLLQSAKSNTPTTLSASKCAPLPPRSELVVFLLLLLDIFLPTAIPPLSRGFHQLPEPIDHPLDLPLQHPKGTGNVRVLPRQHRHPTHDAVLSKQRKNHIISDEIAKETKKTDIPRRKCDHFLYKPAKLPFGSHPLAYYVGEYPQESREAISRRSNNDFASSQCILHTQSSSHWTSAWNDIPRRDRYSCNRCRPGSWGRRRDRRR